LRKKKIEEHDGDIAVGMEGIFADGSAIRTQIIEDSLH
jgi:hypothetical protein